MSISKACKFLGYSKQAYFKARNNEEAKQLKTEFAEAFILEKIKEVRSNLPKLGGLKLYFLIKPFLVKESIQIGRDKFFEILRAHNLLVKRKRRNYKTTDSSKWRKQFDNLVEGLLPSRPEQIWVADITYFETMEEGAVYGHLITDAYSKKIMGFEVSIDMKASSTCKALKMALKNRQYKDELIHHSDRGSQYCSGEYVRVLKRNKIQISMTQSGSPYDNAIAERINRILKEEFLLGKMYLNILEVKKLATSAVGIYNNYRPHWSNYLLTPQQMHQQCEVKIKTWSKKKD